MTLLVLDENGASIPCAWCQCPLRDGHTVTMEGRLSATFGFMYCTPACQQAHRAQMDASLPQEHA
jgi:hypothetical protein